MIHMIIDCHCDALYKMWTDKIDFDDESLDVNYQKWMKSPVKIQCFAIFVPEYLPTEAKFAVAIHMIDLFYEKVVKPYSNVRFIQRKEDIDAIKPHEKGAMLTLEGLDAANNDMYKVRTLLKLGVRMIGMSWNEANLAVDGLKEPRGSGLTAFGREVIKLANEENVWIDLAHISPKGFDEAVDLAEHVIVSHANSQSICPHIRNVTDEQVKKVVEKDGVIGVNFVREFVTEEPIAMIRDVMLHIHYFLSLGAEEHLVFGSDFDGATQFVEELSSVHDYHHVLIEMEQDFSQPVREKISYLNFLRHFPS
ncbi:membrane dipeptidase [Gracilibacillus sp. S3-1-1]|uniref:Membrane dipeptidase n=1 Tax=Gracilibacillus pellucidus TaxID=3095368 RepID=A0ACC6M7U6_9BACI|nr:membrane dipeptidase [Gracilibacillus sp. S3-1-1]MDX8047009.1 membrane dipeptidase [Gracilibacillus sp. S3-1-1]